MVSFSKSSQEGSSRNAVEEPTGRHDNVIFSSQEGSSRNAVEEPTGRDDKVTFSHKGPSRNAVDECPGRVDFRQVTGWSSLRDEKSIVNLKVSRSKLSCNARKRSPDRDTSLGRKRSSHKDEKFIPSRPPQHQSGSWFVFKPKEFRAHSILMLLITIMFQCGAGATNFMTRDQARALSTNIHEDLKSFKRFCSSPRYYGQSFPSLKPHIPNDEIGYLIGNYENGGFRACIQHKPEGTYHRYKFNFALRERDSRMTRYPGPPFVGHSAVGNDAQIYLYQGLVGAHYILTTRQGNSKHGYHYFVVIPFREDNRTHLWIYGTRREQGWPYAPCGETSDNNKFLKHLDTDMAEAWGIRWSRPQQSSASQEYQGTSQWCGPGPKQHNGSWRPNHGSQEPGYSGQTTQRHGGGNRRTRRTGCPDQPLASTVAKILENNWTRRVTTETKKWDGKLNGWLHLNCPKGEFVFDEGGDQVWLSKTGAVNEVRTFNERNNETDQGKHKYVRATVSPYGNRCKCGDIMPWGSIRTDEMLKKGITKYRIKRS